MAGVIRLFIVDGQAIVRRGLSALVNAQSDMTLVGEAGDADTGILSVQELRPDVVLIDLDLPGMSGLDAVQIMRSGSPQTRPIIFSTSCRDADIDAALRLGVWGYISKRAGTSTILSGIRQAAGGALFFCDVVEARIVSRTGKGGERSGKQSRAATLTPREIVITRYLSLGMSVKKVAAMLHVSPKTIDNQKAKIMAKLDIHDRVELSRFAVREGLVGI